MKFHQAQIIGEASFAQLLAKIVRGIFARNLTHETR
jgi:hypothetical protein